SDCVRSGNPASTERRPHGCSEIRRIPDLIPANRPLCGETMRPEARPLSHCRRSAIIMTRFSKQRSPILSVERVPVYPRERRVERLGNPTRLRDASPEHAPTSQNEDAREGFHEMMIGNKVARRGFSLVELLATVM